MSSQSSGGAPVLYEDRTLFPTPMTERHDAPPPRQRAGLSAAGVLLVAALAAAVAAGIVWVVVTMGGGTTGESSQLAELREQNDQLRQQISEFQRSEVADTIKGLEEQVASLNTQLDAREEMSARYREIERLETDIAEHMTDIDELLAEPERRRMPESAEAVDPPPAWIADTEQALRDHLAYVENRVEQITTWPARNPLQDCSDPENC